MTECICPHHIQFNKHVCPCSQKNSALVARNEELVGALEYTSKELTRHKFYKAQGRLLTAVDEALAKASKTALT